LTGIPQPTIHRLISQTTPDPRLSTVCAIAKFFNVSLDYLTNEVSTFIQNTATFHIPVLTLDCAHQFDTMPIEKHILVTDCPHARCFAIESTNSMIHKIALGSLLIVDPEKKPLDGDMVVVRYFAENTNAIREFSKDGTYARLIPLSPALPFEIYDSEKSILGVVIQLLKHL
jgi:SOS-response transcriptional repressor LexA